MQRSVSITYRGIELTVEGPYTPYTPERITADPGDSSPAEGGYFEEYTVKIGETDITDIIDANELTNIGDLAAAEACDGPDPDEGLDDGSWIHDRDMEARG